MSDIEKLFHEDTTEKRKAGRGAAARSGRKGTKKVGIVLPFERMDRRRDPQYRASRCICYSL